MEFWIDIAVGLSTGMVSGLASGYLVYKLTKRRENKYQLYFFCRNYLFDTLLHCKMYLPVKKLEKLFAIDTMESTWGKAIYAIIDDTRPFPLDDDEMSERESRIAENVLVALKELEKWKKENHLH